MSRQPLHSRGARDFSSPQIRVRGTDDFPYHPNRRLRLPNERPPLRRRFAWLFRIVLPLAVMGGIGVGVYFGVTELLNDDGTAEAAPTAAAQTAAAQAQADQSSAAPSQAADSSSSSDSRNATESAEPTVSESGQPAEESASAPASAAEAGQQSAADDSAAGDGDIIHPARLEPSVSADPVTPGQIDGAPLTAERITAEPVPEGIPRNLADGSGYDPAEPATVFTKLWPVGTTLRLTRLPGATLLSDEEQAEVVGTEVLVVVRGSQDSNTDLQLSPAAFDQVAVYGVERIIAVSVEVTAPPR